MGPDIDEREYRIKESRKSRLPLSEQEKCIAELTEAIANLADRLQPVLTPTEPTGKTGEEHPAPVQSEVTMTLNDFNSRIRRATSRVNNLIERLEV